jgi:glycosyltransferase 2 family protein
MRASFPAAIFAGRWNARQCHTHVLAVVPAAERPRRSGRRPNLLSLRRLAVLGLTNDDFPWSPALNLETSSRKPKLLRWAKALFRVTLLILVTLGIWHTVGKAIDDLQARGFDFAQIRPWWLVAAGLIYLTGLLPCWWFWYRTLQAMGQRPRWRETLRAFYIGHLGKYVPGKALVVVLRTDLVRSHRVDTTVAATSVFVETLTMMGVGAFLAAALLGALFREHVWLLGLAIGLMICAGVPTLPPIFRRLVRVAGVRRVNPDIDAALAGLDGRLMAFGWITVGLGWWLLGLSLWAVMQAIPVPVEVTLQHLPLLTACVALAMVAGFLSLLPGGIGIREYVVMTLLAGPFGAGVAAISAILLRLVWLLGELILAGILYTWRLPAEEELFLEGEVRS